LLQNSVGDANELAYVKQIGNQDIARGNPSLATTMKQKLDDGGYDQKTTMITIDTKALVVRMFLKKRLRRMDNVFKQEL
jgi:hypothetical protein